MAQPTELAFNIATIVDEWLDDNQNPGTILVGVQDIRNTFSTTYQRLNDDGDWEPVDQDELRVLFWRDHSDG